MSTIEAPPRVTAEEFLTIAERGNYELVHGEVREKSVSVRASWTGGQFFGGLNTFALQSGLGFAFPPDTLLRIWPSDPNHLRSADAAYIRAARLPGGLLPDTGYLEITPDLVAEAVSRHDQAEDVERKVREYLAAGVGLVWVAYPVTRTVHVYRANGTADVLDDTGTLSGEELLPGLNIPVAAIFPPQPTAAS
ncbi:MAG: Uma2 family endonuclease [Dehalococcoidia bacterium]